MTDPGPSAEAGPGPLAIRCAESVCRSCGRRGLEPILDLGSMPLSDGFLSEPQLDQEEPRFPLELAFCSDCTLVQILETVPPEVLFCQEYPYFSSFSQTLLDHSRSNALELAERCGLSGASLVVELASNDGYLLRNFRELGIPVLGIDPADGPARAAEEIGVPTLTTFFTRELAQRLKAEGRQADVIIANNVLAHVADTNGFVAGVKTLLKEGGVASIEFPYVRDLIDHGEFDTIYHEHLCYFSLRAVDALLRRHGLFLNDVRRLPIHGGSLRLYVGHDDLVQPSVRALLAEETELGLDGIEYYRDFADRVRALRQQMCELLGDLKRQGHRLAAYGAAAKGTIMLNYLGADRRTIEFVVDRNVHKQGLWVPGVRIPILAPEELVRQMPSHTLILPWNFKDEILQQQAAYRAKGGRFIVPIPRPQIL
jgi:SAM-dependent methyltransferase